MRVLKRQAITHLAALLLAAPALAQPFPALGSPEPGRPPQATPPPRAAPPRTTTPSGPAPAPGAPRRSAPRMGGGEPVSSPPAGPATPPPVPRRLQPGGQAVEQLDDEEAAPRPRVYRPPSSAAPAPRRALPAVRSDPNRDPVEDLIVRSQDGVSFATMLDELLDELTHQLVKESPRPLSPMAIRLVRVSPNLRQTLAQTIEAKVMARLSKVPNLEQVMCLECRSVRSRVEGDDWVVTLGAVRQSDLRRIASDIGAKAFLELDLTFQQVPTELVLVARIYRADDGHILWATSIKGDETTAAILRTGKTPPSREEQLAELKRKLEARPYWGYLAFVGFQYIPATGPGYFGLNPGIRIFERFGTERRHLFGLQGEGMINWAQNRPLFGGTLSVGYWYSLLTPNLNKPDLRIGATIGGFIVGTEGNTVMVQVNAEYVLQFRLAVSVAALYAFPVKYMGEDIGGIGGAARAAFQW